MEIVENVGVFSINPTTEKQIKELQDWYLIEYGYYPNPAELVAYLVDRAYFKKLVDYD